MRYGFLIDVSGSVPNISAYITIYVECKYYFSLSSFLRIYRHYNQKAGIFCTISEIIKTAPVEWKMTACEGE